jgi:hypothetical protein
VNLPPCSISLTPLFDTFDLNEEEINVKETIVTDNSLVKVEKIKFKRKIDENAYFEEIKFPILYKNYIERTNFTYNNKYNVVYSKPSDQSFLNENFEPVIDLKDNKNKFKTFHLKDKIHILNCEEECCNITLGELRSHKCIDCNSPYAIYNKNGLKPGIYCKTCANKYNIKENAEVYFKIDNLCNRQLCCEKAEFYDVADEAKVKKYCEIHQLKLNGIVMTSRRTILMNEKRMREEAKAAEKLKKKEDNLRKKEENRIKKEMERLIKLEEKRRNIEIQKENTRLRKLEKKLRKNN